MSERTSDPDLDIEEGGGPPYGTAWTLEVTGDAGWSADLEHAAPLPRIDETIELIQSDGSRHRFQVRDVVHVVQPSATGRPAVREEGSGPNSIVTGEEESGRPRLLRAGLPRVVASPADVEPSQPTTTQAADTIRP